MNQSIIIGTLLMLSGEFAQYGKAVLTGMQLAAKEPAYQEIVLSVEDTQGPETAQAVTALKALRNKGEPVAVLNMIANNTKAIAPILTKAKIPGLVVWDSNKQIESLGEYLFGFGYSTELAGESLASFVAEDLKLKRVAVISMADAWSEVVTPAFIEKVKQLGGEIVFSTQVSPSESDFRSLVPRIKLSKAEVVFLPLYGIPLTSSIRQLRVGGFSGALVTGDSMSELEVEQAGTENAEGMYLSQIWFESGEFKRKYLEINKEEPSAVHLGLASLGYDSFKCVADAALRLKRSRQGRISGESIRVELSKEPCIGIAGKVDYKNGRLSERRERILKVEKGKLVKSGLNNE